jgi:hypothetical protein
MLTAVQTGVPAVSGLPRAVLVTSGQSAIESWWPALLIMALLALVLSRPADDQRRRHGVP